MTPFTVEHRPTEANPAELPWCVLKHGAPFIWYRHEVFAEGFAFASNRGDDFEGAKAFVQSMPDDLSEAAAFLAIRDLSWRATS